MKKERLLILTERFFPEEFLINDLATAWQQRDYEVEVLTQEPSYPHDTLYDGYTNRFLQTTRELYNIPIHRVRTLLGYNTSLIKKILNYVSFAFLTSLWAIFNGWRYHAIFIYHTGPLTMATASIIFRFLYWKKTMIWTQDVWPDTVYAYGFKQTRLKKWLLNTFVSTIYSACRTISVSSPSFVQKLAPYTKRPVHFIPQWTTQTTLTSSTRTKKKKRIFTFAGNLGSVQNLEMLVDVFGKLNPADAELHLVGGGVMLDTLREHVAQSHYQNIRLPGRLPQSEMPQLFANSDILIISLKSEFAMTLPAKFQAYIAAGRPIFGIIGGDTAELIQTHHLGLACEPTPKAIEATFKQFFKISDECLKTWGKNALNLSQSEFDRLRIIERMTRILSSH